MVNVPSKLNHQRSLNSTSFKGKLITLVNVLSKINSQYIFSITELTFSVHGAVLHECQRERETFECFPPLYSPSLFFVSRKPSVRLRERECVYICMSVYMHVWLCVCVCVCVCVSVCVRGRENESRGKRFEVKERKMKERQKKGKKNRWNEKNIKKYYFLYKKKDKRREKRLMQTEGRKN
jgi:hypothetical protein